MTAGLPEGVMPVARVPRETSTAAAVALMPVCEGSNRLSLRPDACCHANIRR